MNSAACRAAGQTGRGSPEKRQPTRNATSSGKRGSARVRATAMTCAELGRMVGRTEVNATPGVNLRPLFITVPSNLGRHRKLRRNTMSHWYENKDGSTKTHNRVRTCGQCRENPRCGCALPFRKARKVRWFAALDKKPVLFRSLRFSKFTRSN